MNIAAMTPNDVLGYGKAQPRTSGFRIARLIQPVKGPKNLFAFSFWNARPVIIDCDFNRVASLSRAHPNMVRIAIRVGDKIV